MPREAYASVRLPADLKSKIQRIADTEERSLSNAIELLLRLGVARYRQTQRIIEHQKRDRELDDQSAIGSLLEELPKERQEDVVTYVRALHSARASTDGIKKSGRRAA